MPVRENMGGENEQKRKVTSDSRQDAETARETRHEKRGKEIKQAKTCQKRSRIRRKEKKDEASLCALISRNVLA